MEKANYVLLTKEAVRIPKGNSKMKLFVIIILGAILLLSILFGENLFKELSWITKLLLIMLILGVLFAGWEFKPFPMAISFFDDRLVVNRSEVYYDRKTTRREIYEFKYTDVRCTYHQKEHRMELRGLGDAKLFDFDKSGKPSVNPTRAVRDVGICYFYTSAAPEVDFVAEIEAHSPLKVEIK